MSVPVTWYDVEHSILVVTIYRGMTWADYHRCVDAVISEASQVNHRVDVIFDDNVGMPPGNPLPHLKQGVAKMTSQSNIKTLNISGTRGSYGFVKAIIEIVAKSFFKRRSAVPFGTGVFAASLDEAVAHIRAERAKEVPAN